MNKKEKLRRRKALILGRALEQKLSLTQKQVWFAILGTRKDSAN